MSLPPIDPSVLRVEPSGQIALLGGYSPSSGLRHFPRAPVCPFTGADDVAPLDLQSYGTVWLHTTVTAPPPGYGGDVPYRLGIVELDGEPVLRVVTRLLGDVEVGSRVRLVGVPVPDPAGEPAFTWAFEAAE